MHTIYDLPDLARYRVALIKSKILITKGMSWQASSDKWKAS